MGIDWSLLRQPRLAESHTYYYMYTTVGRYMQVSLPASHMQIESFHPESSEWEKTRTIHSIQSCNSKLITNESQVMGKHNPSYACPVLHSSYSEYESSCLLAWYIADTPYLLDNSLGASPLLARRASLDVTQWVVLRRVMCDVFRRYTCMHGSHSILIFAMEKTQ